MEDYEEGLFDLIRQRILDSGESTSRISEGSGVAYYTIVAIKKNNKNRAYNAGTYAKLKAYLKII